MKPKRVLWRLKESPDPGWSEAWAIDEEGPEEGLPMVKLGDSQYSSSGTWYTLTAIEVRYRKEDT